MALACLFDQLSVLIDVVETTDAPLAQQLRELAERYEYDRRDELLRRPRASGAGETVAA